VQAYYRLSHSLFSQPFPLGMAANIFFIHFQYKKKQTKSMSEIDKYEKKQIFGL
jgi:hypothetical protein